MKQALLENHSSVKVNGNSPTLTSLRLAIFSSAWALATLFHMANKRIFEDELHLVLLTGAAIFLLFKPTSILRVVLLLLLQLFDVTESMPGVSNHWIFTAFVNLTILFSLFFHIIKRQSFYINKEEFYQTFAPIVRIELILLYFFVVFHKLNSGFFNLESSCATDLYLFQNAYGILPETPIFLSLNAFFTIFVEALIPLLLCYRKTRNIGILTGLLFHTLIAFNPYNGFYDFSAMVFALYFLFSDSAFSYKTYQLFRGLKNKVGEFKEYRPEFSLRKLMEFSGFSILAFIVLFFLTRYSEDFYRHIFWGFYSVIFIAISFTTFNWGKKKAVKENKLFYVAHWSLLIFPFLVFFNGMSPYLGLKTENSFAMFSNLRTEGDQSNHFIVPASFQLFDFQDELVEVVCSTEPQLQALAEQNKLLVYYEFKHMVSHLYPEQVDYIRGGEFISFKLGEATQENELLQRNGFFFRKLFRFRPIAKHNPQPCAH